MEYRSAIKRNRKLWMHPATQMNLRVGFHMREASPKRRMLYDYMDVAFF